MACFKKALEADPRCVMAHWGIAYGSGPFYNFVWRDFGPREAETITRRAYEHILKARSLAAGASDIENAMVAALSRRFQQPNPVAPEDYDCWDDDYAAEMRRLHHLYPDDHDIMALFAEALITRTPRRLWDLKTGRPCSSPWAAVDRATFLPSSSL